MLYSAHTSKLQQQPYSFVFEDAPRSGFAGNSNIRFDFHFKDSLNTKRKASEVEHVLKSGLMTEYQKNGPFRKKYFPTTYYGEVVVTLDVVRLERCTNCCYVAVDRTYCAEAHAADQDVMNEAIAESEFPLDRVASKQSVMHAHSQSSPKRLKEDYYFYMTIALELNGTTTQTSKCYARLEFASQIRNHQADEPDCYRLKLFTKSGRTALSSQGTISCVHLDAVYSMY